jgi:integrase
MSLLYWQERIASQAHTSGGWWLEADRHSALSHIQDALGPYRPPGRGEPSPVCRFSHMELDHDGTRRPCTASEEGRERFLTSDELARLGDALAEAETIGLPYTVDEAKPNVKHAPKPENRRRKLDHFAIAAVRLLILTGARLREILTAKWEYIDFERGLMNLPTSKTGRKSIFLSAAALEVLCALPRIDSNPHIILGQLEDHGERGLVRETSFGAHCSVADRRE